MGNRRGRDGGWPARGMVALLALAAVTPNMARAEGDVVRLGDLPTMSNGGVYIAVEKGYFKAQGIRNEITTFVSAAKMVPALTAGEMEVSVGTATAGLLNAIVQGAGFRVVADKGSNRPGYGYTMLSVRKDLVDSGQVKGVRDLKGRKVAVFAKGAMLDYVLGRMAEEVGLGIADFDLVYMGAPNQLTALETKAIDAAMTVEPWGARFEEQGLAVRLRTADQVKGLAPVQTGVIMFSGTFITERRAVAQRWMTAYLRGCDFYTTRGLQDPEVLAIFEKYTKVPAKAIKGATPFYLERSGRLNLDNLADQIDWYAAHGMLMQRIPVDNVVDLSFLKK